MKLIRMFPNHSSQILNSSLTINHLENHQRLRSQIEKECKIQNITPLRLNVPKAILFTALIGATVFGLVLVVWYKWLRVKIWFSTCPIEQADYLYIESECANDDIQRIVRQEQRVQFYFKKLKYILQGNNYAPVVLDYENKFNSLVTKKYLKSGMSEEKVLEYLNQYGRNEHAVEFPSFFVYLGNVVLDPFFLVQYSVCILDMIFALQGYLMFGLINIGLSFIVISINYLLTGYAQIKQETAKTTLVRVLRNSKFVEVQSSLLVPGDIIEPEGEIVCDCILVKGEAEVNQKTLSGSSRNVWKVSANLVEETKQPNRWLYDGSQLLQKRSNVLALVINTGYTTRRGRFIRKILTKPLQTSQTMKSTLQFWLMTFTIAYIIYCISIFLMKVKNVPDLAIGTRFIDFLGWSFPPAFSIYCNLTYLFQIIRLKSKGIRSIIPDKTAEACNIKLMCFDKTGTLTQNQVEIHRIFRFVDETNIMDISDELHDKNNWLVRKIFATCHSLKHRRDVQNIPQQGVQGNEIDEKLFAFSGYRMRKEKKLSIIHSIESIDKQEHLEILRLNQFEPEHQSMSVLVRDNSSRKHYIFVKGAPERIQQKSTLKIAEFEKEYVHLSLNGYLTLGFGYKTIEEADVPRYLKLPRQQFEDSIISLGLVTFENKLRPETQLTIQKIVYSGIKPLVLTGDNIYTAIESAIHAGIISTAKKVLILQGRSQDHLNYQFGTPRKFKANLITHQGRTVMSQYVQIEEDENYLKQPYWIAVDSDFLSLDPQPKISSDISIFARMSPQKKSWVIKQLRKNIQNQYEKRSLTSRIFGSFKHRVGMCGDGANDLMALREADVGIGLNSSDSVAGCTFAINSLLDIDELIRDNKAATVNIVEMTLYYDFICFLKIPAALLMLMDDAYFSDSQTFYINYASTMVYPILLAMSKPSKFSTHTTPNGNLIAPINLVRFWGSLIIATAGLVGGYFYFRHTEQYQLSDKPLTGEKWNTYTLTGTSIFLLVLPHFSLYPIFFYIGQPWKEKLYKNIPLLILIVLNSIACVIIYFNTSLANTQLNLYAITLQTASVLLLISVGSLVVAYVFNMAMKQIILQVEDRTGEKLV